MATVPRVAIVIDLEWPLAYHLQTFAGIYRYASARGWRCLLTPYLDSASVTSYDAVIGRITPSLAGAARRAGRPVVNVWMNSSAKNVVSVLPDAAESGRMAARHLIARGFRKFGYLGHQRDRFSRLQAAGLREELAAAGCLLLEYATGRLQPQEKTRWLRFQHELDTWMDDWKFPMAVVLAYDQMARYAAETAYRRGLKIPTELALVGSINEAAICTMLDPSLSSIDFGFERIGYRAAETLDLLLSGAKPAIDTIYITPRQLIIRQSSGGFAVEDPAMTKTLSYIGENLHKALTLEHLAQLTATTPRTLSRLFQKSLGKTVHEAITQLRIERVKRELVESDDLLKVIARRCGFRDAVYLCKVFQGHEKITPTQYRASR